MPPAIPLPDISSTIGAWSIGALASVGLLGVTTLQCWMYYSKFSRDPVWLKILVALVWCLEAARTTVCVHGAYYYTILHWGDIFALVLPTWSLELMILLTIFVALLTHSFFAHQVRSLTRGHYRILFYVIVVFTLGDFGLGVASYILAVLSEKTFSVILLGTPAHIATAALCCAIITDWTITGSLVCFLHKNSTHKTRGLMQALTLYTINFGFLISMTDIVVLVMANFKWPNDNLYAVSLFEVIGNFYANTMLASLNSRTLVAEYLYSPNNLHFTSINAADIPDVLTLDIADRDNHILDVPRHAQPPHNVTQQQLQRQERSQRRRSSVEYQLRLSDSWSSNEGGGKDDKSG